MPYILLVLGILAALFALYRFIVKSPIEDIKALFRGVFFLVYALILLFFAMTGRLIISIALVVLAIPFVIAWFRNRSKTKILPAPPTTDDDIIENDEDND